MGKDFYVQSRHVVDATIGLGGDSLGISAAGSFIRSRYATDLSNLSKVFHTEAGLCWPQRHAWKCWDTVDFILNFIRLDIQYV